MDYNASLISDMRLEVYLLPLLTSVLVRTLDMTDCAALPLTSTRRRRAFGSLASSNLSPVTSAAAVQETITKDSLDNSFEHRTLTASQVVATTLTIVDARSSTPVPEPLTKDNLANNHRTSTATEEVVATTFTAVDAISTTPVPEPLTKDNLANNHRTSTATEVVATTYTAVDAISTTAKPEILTNDSQIDGNEEQTLAPTTDEQVVDTMSVESVSSDLLDTISTTAVPANLTKDKTTSSRTADRKLNGTVFEEMFVLKLLRDSSPEVGDRPLQYFKTGRNNLVSDGRHVATTLPNQSLRLKRRYITLHATMPISKWWSWKNRKISTIKNKIYMLPVFATWSLYNLTRPSIEIPSSKKLRNQSQSPTLSDILFRKYHTRVTKVIHQPPQRRHRSTRPHSKIRSDSNAHVARVLASEHRQRWTFPNKNRSESDSQSVEEITTFRHQRSTFPNCQVLCDQCRRCSVLQHAALCHRQCDRGRGQQYWRCHDSVQRSLCIRQS